MTQDTSNNITPTIESIGYFRVTSRPGEQILEFCHYSEDELKQLPNKATVVEIGSGLFQEFAKYVKGIRTDLNVVSVDPSLAFKITDDNHIIDPKEETIYDVEILKKDGELDSLRYGIHIPDGHTDEYRKQAAEYHRQRQSHAKENGGIAALAPNIPMPDGSVDLLVDSFGACTWYCGEDQEYTEQYFSEVQRLLSDRGIAVIFPVESVAEFLGTGVQTDEQRQQLAKERLIPVFVKLDMLYEFFEHEVKDVDGNSLHRLGVRIIQNED
jgi:hypothetical protein